MKKAIIAAITVVVLIVLFYVVYALIGKICAVNLGAEVKLPLVAIAGVILLLPVLAVVSVAFGVSGLSDKTQALALPEGSVRAVIALALVVLFATLSVFLFESVSSGPARTVPSLTEAQKDEFLKNNKTATDIVVKETGEGTEKTYAIDYRDPTNKRVTICQAVVDDVGDVARQPWLHHYSGPGGGVRDSGGPIGEDDPEPAKYQSVVTFAGQGALNDFRSRGQLLLHSSRSRSSTKANKSCNGCGV